MDYRVLFVNDGDLPKCQDWAMTRTRSEVDLFIKRDAVTPAALEEAWAAYRRLAARRPVRVAKIAALTLGVLAFGLQPWVTTETLSAAIG